ncbi:capsule biosynthesis protein (plasmid) [Bacillus tropicus]|uniref:capsule synthesis transcriptional regulator AcpA n=1 Tax=Bacillus tropicus TaxID=2026188 RepID=UPI000A205EFF|nr:capsule biosynthesis protein [Bacillus cereus]
MEKDISRKIDLLNILIEEKRWFTLFELEKNLNCSSKTIRKDISIINDLLPKTIFIHSKKGKGVKLSLPQNQSISEAISNLLKKSLTFLAIQQLLEERSNTVTSLADKLYLPISSTNIVLKRVSKYIKKFGLSLEKKPLRIVGDEFQIILMFSERYLESYPDTEWPFTEYKEEMLIDYINYIEEKLEIVFYSNDKRRMAFIMTILFKRIKQGHKVKFSEWIIKETMESIYYKKIFEGKNVIKVNKNRSLNIEEQVLLVIMVKLSRYVSKDENNLKQEELVLYKEGKSTTYTYVKNFISILEQELKIDLNNNEEFVYGMIEYCREAFHILKFIPILKAPEKDTCKYIKKHYEETFHLVKRAYNKWGAEMKLTNIPDEEIAKVTMRIVAIGKQHNINRKKVLLITGEGKSWEEYMKSRINKRYGDQLKFVGGHAKILNGNTDNIDNIDIDFIITTVPLNFSWKSIVYVSPILQERDFYEIGIFASK